MARLAQRLVLPVIVLVWGGFFLSEVLKKSARAALLIHPVYILLCLLGVVIAFNDLRQWRRENLAAKIDVVKTEVDEQSKPESDVGPVLICSVATALYLVAFETLGFILSTVLFLFGAFVALGTKNKILALAIAGVLTGALWLSFDLLLGVPLPTGFFVR